MCAWRAACLIWRTVKHRQEHILSSSLLPEQQLDLRDNSWFMKPLMNYFSVQVPVSLRPGCMCHCSDISLCLFSSKPAHYPETLIEGTTSGWRFRDDHSSDPQRCVCLQGEVSSTRPPALLINKFMSERDTKWLLEGFQCHPSLSPAISLLQQWGAEQNYLPPVNNKEVYETWRMRWHTTWNTNEEGARRSKCYILISTVTLYYAVDSP